MKPISVYDLVNLHSERFKKRWTKASTTHQNLSNWKCHLTRNRNTLYRVYQPEIYSLWIFIYTDFYIIVELHVNAKISIKIPFYQKVTFKNQPWIRKLGKTQSLCLARLVSTIDFIAIPDRNKIEHPALSCGVPFLLQDIFSMWRYSFGLC